MDIYTGPTPPVIGTRIQVIPKAIPPAGTVYVYEPGEYETTVTGFDPFDGAVFTEHGEIVANHLDDCSGYRII